MSKQERRQRTERAKMLDPTVGSAEAEPGPDANDALLQSIKLMMDDLRSDILSKFDSIVADAVKREMTGALRPMERKMEAQGRTIVELEHATSAQADEVTELQVTVSTLSGQVKSLSDKCEDLESRQRLNNIRLIGLPEGLEGPRPTESVAEILKDLLSLDDLPVLDRCHRSLRARPKDGEPPRPLIMRVNLFQVRNLILRRAGECSPLNYKGKRLSIFADFTQAVAKKRAAFAAVKKELHSCPGVKFGLMFPAVLRITPADGQMRRFEDPERAMDFVVKKLKKVVVPDEVA